MPTSGNAKISAKLTASDGQSGLKTLQYAWSTSGTTQPTSWSTFKSGSTITKSDVTKAGTWYLWVNVVDNGGNRASTKVSKAFVVKAKTDTTSKITITPNTTAWTNANVVCTITYGSTLTKNKKAGYGTTLSAAQSAVSTSTAAKVTVSANGYVYAEATDAAGNKVTASKQITNIDKVKPELLNLNKGVSKLSDPTFASGTGGAVAYNNSGNGTVTVSRVAASSDIPTTSKYMLQIKTNGTASPGLGGFVAQTQSERGRVYRHKIIAKIPKGYKISSTANGSNYKIAWFSSREGTGEWEVYEYEISYQTSGTFTSFGHVYLEKTTATSNSVTWNVAYSNIIDLNAGGAIFKQNDPTFASGVNSAIAYNNNNNGAVTVSRVSKSSDIPTTSSYMLQIKTNGSATPGLGGYYQATTSAANQVFRHRIIAKIPKGYKINCGANSIGNNSHFSWLTSQEGTGEWEVYEYQVTCGDSGTFSTFGHVYLTKTTATSNNVTWYVAYSTVMDEIRYMNKKAWSLALSDNASGVYQYGFSSSSTTAPSYTTNSRKGKVGYFDITINQFANEYLWIKDVAGNTSVYRITHFISPIITAHPSSVTVSAGSTATFTVAAQAGAPDTSPYTLSYQWQYRTSSSGSWANCTTSGNGDYTTTKKEPNITSSMNGYQFRCKVTNGIYTIYSNPATLNVSSPSIPPHTCNTNGYCNKIHSHSAWACESVSASHNGTIHTTFRHPICTVCGKISASWLKCPERPNGTEMPCPQ